LKTERDKMSYGLSMDIGRNITNQQIEVSVEALTAGIKAVVNRTAPLLTEQQVQEAMTAFRTEMMNKRNERMKKQQEQMKANAEKGKLEGQAFLAENKKKEGVVTLPSGLQYKVYTAGTGRKPTSNDTVVTHYRGSFIDGKEFDSSYRSGGPVTFKVTQVIKGWQEALQLMPVGSKWKLFVPAELAYGDVGQPPKIPAHAALLFDIELISIEDPAAANKSDKPKSGQ
jgi:FKBP-type peptidyl-prolyl cis-trans isomerase FklB